jgi:hypothetical protein
MRIANPKKKSDPAQKARRGSGESKAVDGDGGDGPSKPKRATQRRAPAVRDGDGEKNVKSIVLIAVIAILLLSLVGGAVWMVMNPK